MKVCILIVSIALTCSSALAVGPGGEPFRFSLTIEPSGADPARIGSSESNYFLVNVLRGLYFVDAKGRARPEIAESCQWQKSIKPFSVLECRLKKGAKWSDGKAIVANDFVDSWRRLVLPTAKGFGAAIIRDIKNSKAIYKGLFTADSLGVKAISSHVLQVTLEEGNREFIELLAHPALAATRTGFSYDEQNATKAPMSGPYRIIKWKPRIRLESNPHYETIQKTGVTRPPVEVLTVDDDETALNLYREGTLSLLRRLPTHYLKNWKDSKELAQIPVARFDYVGFGPALRDQPNFRRALVRALNYDEMRVIYMALGIPGCPGLDPAWMDKVPCHTYDRSEAEKIWAKVPADLKTKRWTLSFSRLGGDDIQKGMEWMQAQWKKHLNLTVDLKPVEQGLYVSGLRKDPPDLFRKGVGLDRATCLSAVEVFGKNHPENFIRLDSTLYETKLAALRKSGKDAERRRACTEAVQVLIDEALVIPLGRIHFSMLVKPRFKGWVLNPLNHLDLSHLQAD